MPTRSLSRAHTHKHATYSVPRREARLKITSRSLTKGGLLRKTTTWVILRGISLSENKSDPPKATHRAIPFMGFTWKDKIPEVNNWWLPGVRDEAGGRSRAQPKKGYGGAFMPSRHPVSGLCHRQHSGCHSLPLCKTFPLGRLGAGPRGL